MHHLKNSHPYNGGNWATLAYGAALEPHTSVRRESPIVGAGLVSIAGRGNKVYLAWQDSRVGGGSHDGIVLARSTDGGANWWDAVRVNGSDTIPAFTPTVSVRRDGIVAVSYYELASASALPSSPSRSASPSVQQWCSTCPSHSAPSSQA